MKSLYDWIGNMLGTAAFAVTLFTCVSGGQDLLICAVKSIGAFFVVRVIAGLLSNVILAMEVTARPPGARAETPESDS